jgi:diadenosine tetraphosphate (Ap4A) HIT family hydrolase
MKINCVFCKTTFPDIKQQIDNKLKYWNFIHDISPICDFHCLIVLKQEITNNIGTHISDISDTSLSEEVLTEL